MIGGTVGAGSGVASFNGRSGPVTPQPGDYSVGQVTGAAPLASPALTGAPTAPTAPAGTYTTQIATTAFVQGFKPAFSAVTGQATLSQLPNLPAANEYCNATTANAAPTNCPALIHSLSFATGNGTTDDTAALGNWISACQTTGAVCFLDTPTSCYKTSSALLITTSITILGANNTAAGICPSSATQDGIDVNTTGTVVMSNFNIAPSAAATSGSCINVITGGQNSKFDHLFLHTCFIGITLTNAVTWVVDSVNVANPVSANLVSSGWGDSVIANSEFTQASSSTNGIVLNGSSSGVSSLSGGLRIVSNKFNSGLSGGTGVAILLNDTIASVNLSDLIIAANSIEAFSIGVELEKGSIASMANVRIDGNEFESSQCVVTDTNSGWLLDLSIAHNLCRYSTAGFVIGDPAGFTVSDNHLNGLSGSGTGVTVASGASKGPRLRQPDLQHDRRRLPGQRLNGPRSSRTITAWRSPACPACGEWLDDSRLVRRLQQHRLSGDVHDRLIQCHRRPHSGAWKNC